jgi:hypothetical protein
MSEIEVTEERPLNDLTRDKNPGELWLEPEDWVEDVQVERD